MGDILLCDRFGFHAAFGNLRRDTPARIGDFTLQIANPGFTCVTGNDSGKRFACQLELFVRQPVFLQLPRD